MEVKINCHYENIDKLTKSNSVVDIYHCMQQNTRSWTDEDLKIAVAINVSFAGILRSLKLSSSPGNYKSLKIHIKRLNLSTAHLLGKAHGTTIPFKKIPTSEILVENSSYSSTTDLKQRLFKEELLKNECYICKMPPVWQEQAITLQLDHINGNSLDNRIENLRILCPNCHSQTKTFTGSNLPSRYRRIVTRCIDCQSSINLKSTRCLKCAGSYRETKVPWPPARELAEEVVKTSYRAAGKRLNVTDAAVKKYLKRKLGHAPKKHKVSHGGHNKLSS